MKLSKFNNKVKYQDTSYIYNSFSDKFFALDPTLLLMFDALQSESEIAELSAIHPTFYDALQQNEFILADDHDEIEKVKQLSKKVDTQDTHFTLIINPTMNCNFKCWYCYETHEKGSKMNEGTVQHVYNFIENVIADNPNLKTFHISWFGGEPLLYYAQVIDPVMEFAHNYCAEHGIYLDFRFTTNGYLFTDHMIQRLTKYRVTGFQITLDGNRNHHNSVRYVNSTKGSYDTIIENIGKLCSNGMRVGIRVNYTNHNLLNFEDVFTDLCAIAAHDRKNASIAFHKVWQESESEVTDQRVKELINMVKVLGFIAEVGAVPDNVRHSCYADRVNSATINYNGHIYKCTARNFSAESKEGVLNVNGYIDWTESVKERMDIKFKNKPCLQCSIMPLCNGGCSQHALENKDKDYCVYNFDESLKKGVILKKLAALVD